MKNLHHQLALIYRKLQTGDTCLGIDIGEDMIRMVQLRKGWRRYRILKTASLPRSSTEALAGHISGAIREHRMQSTYTAINLPEPGILWRTLTVPAGENEDITGYLHRHSEAFLPPGLALHQVQFNFAVLNRQEDRLQVLLLLYRSSLTGKYEPLIKALKPSQMVYAPLSWECYLAHFHPDFSGLVVFGQERQVFAFSYLNGRFTGHQSGNSDAAMEEFLARLPAAESGTGRGTPATPYRYLLLGSSPSMMRIERHLESCGLSPLRDAGDTVEAPFRLALSLGLLPFIKPFNEFDLLPDHGKQQAVQHYFRRLTVKSFLCFGLALMLLALALYGLQGVLAWQNQQYDRRQSTLRPFIRQRDSLNVVRQTSLRSLESFDHLTRQRTRYAIHLLQIAGALPEDVWLTRLETAEEKEQTALIRVEGLALDEARASRYLKNLEALAITRQAMLRELITLGRKQVYQEWRLSYSRLTRFRIELYVRH